MGKIDLSFLPDKTTAKKTVDFSFLPDKKSVDLSFLPDKQKPDLSFLPDRLKISEEDYIPVSEKDRGLDIISKPLSIFIASKFKKEEPKRTEGLFGTSLGSRSEILEKLRIPENVSREGLRMMLDKIPEPKTRSVALNALINVPKTSLNVLAEFSTAFLSPEAALLTGAGAIARPVSKTPLFKKAVETIGEYIPGGVKRVFTYRFGQPEAYREMAENAILESKKGAEKAIEIGEELEKGLSRAEQLRAGQIMKGSVSIGGKETKLRNIVEKARDEMTQYSLTLFLYLQ